MHRNSEAQHSAASALETHLALVSRGWASLSAGQAPETEDRAPGSAASRLPLATVLAIALAIVSAIVSAIGPAIVPAIVPAIAPAIAPATVLAIVVATALKPNFLRRLKSGSEAAAGQMQMKRKSKVTTRAGE